MAMEIEETACYYCPWATDDLQTCINHVVEAHGERLLKVKRDVLDEQSSIRGMKTKNFGIIPNEILRPGKGLHTIATCSFSHHWTKLVTIVLTYKCIVCIFCIYKCMYVLEGHKVE